MHFKRSCKALSALSLALLAAIAIDPRRSNAQATCAQEVANIQAYSKKLDKLMKQGQGLSFKRTFARQPIDAREQAGEWIEVGSNVDASRSAFAETAFAWTIDGKIVASQLIMESRAGDWVHRVLYYFREDGTLARISSTLNISLGARIVVREQFYDRNGVMLSKSSQHYTLRAKNKLVNNQVDEPVPVFLKPSELPFYDASGA